VIGTVLRDDLGAQDAVDLVYLDEHAVADPRDWQEAAVDYLPNGGLGHAHQASGFADAEGYASIFGVTM
jgi:hypothetical protein